MVRGFYFRTNTQPLTAAERRIGLNKNHETKGKYQHMDSHRAEYLITSMILNASAIEKYNNTPYRTVGMGLFL